jgi:hypothetical protein
MRAKKKPKVTGAETSMFVAKRPHNEGLYGIDYEARQSRRDAMGPFSSAKQRYKDYLDNPIRGREDDPETNYHDKYKLLFELLKSGFGKGSDISNVGTDLNPSTAAAGAIRGILKSSNPDKFDIIDTSRIPLTKRHVQRLIVENMPKPEIKKR